MSWQVLIAHAPGEEHWAEALAHPIREAGYKVSHLGTVLAGESVVEEASRALAAGGPVLLCGTVQAVGTRWARRLVNAARTYPEVQVIVVQVEKEADVESLAFGERIVRYWQDPALAMGELLETLHSRYPVERVSPRARGYEAEVRYVELALCTFDAVDLVGLPVERGHLADQMPPPLHRLYVPLTVNGLEPQSSVGEALAAARRLVVLGDPGSGKTTLVRWLATAYLRKELSPMEWVGLPDVNTLPHDSLLPVVVSCRDLDPAAVAGSLDDVLRHTLRKAELSESDVADLGFRLRERLREGRVLLLVDGLDAIADLRARAGFCRQIEQIAIAYPRTLLVVTSRPAAYRELGDPLSRSFRTVTLADWSRADQDRFVQHWFLWSEPQLDQREQKTAELLRAIHGTQRIERLASNPLLLTVMALVKPKIGSLPQRRAELYWEAVQVLLGRLSGAGAPLPVREVLPQLEHLAYALCERAVQQLTQDEALAVLTAFRSRLPASHPIHQPVHAHSPEELLLLVERSTGLLRRAGERRHLGMSVPVFELCHPMFQEYLAARAVVDGHGPLSSDQPLAQRIAPLASRTVALPNGEIVVRDPWQEVVRLAVACSGDEVDDVLRALLQPLPGEDEARTARCRTVLAALCLADEPEVGEATAQEVLDGLARQVSDREGSPLWRTSLDHAVRDLAKSRWVPQLRLALVRELRARPAAERWSLGFLFTKLTAISEPAGRETPASNSEEEDTTFALEAVGAAFAAEVNGRGLAERLLPLLERDPATAHAAAWALYSLLGRDQDASPWQPTAQDVERIAHVAARPGLDSAAAWCLGKIIGRIRPIG